MTILDRFFYFLYVFSRKHRGTDDYLGAIVLLISILLFLNLLCVLNLIDIFGTITIMIPNLMALILILLVYATCSIYFYQKKRYLRIIRSYGRKKSNRYVNILMTFYVFISLMSIFIVGFIRLLFSS